MEYTFTTNPIDTVKTTLFPYRGKVTILKNKGKYIFNSDFAETKYVSPNIKISTVTCIKDLKDFFRVPWFVYQNDVYWVAPFWIALRDFFKTKNPFWTHAKTRLFIAYQDNIAVGRIAAIIDNKFCETIGEKIGYFGFFECIQDFSIASALFEVAEEWLASKEISLMRGPINGRIDVGCGFLYKGFNSAPSILSSYTPKYYLNFAKKYGMKKSRDQLVYYLDLTQQIPDYLKKSAKRCEAKGVRVRRFNRLQSRKEMKWWIKLMIDIFSEHWGYVPVSDDEVKTRFGIKQLKWFVDSRLFLVAEADNQPIAFIWSTPDYNQAFKKMNGKLGIIGILKFLWHKQKISQGKLNLIGSEKKYRNQGVASLLNYHTMLEMKKRGYKGAEIGWVDEHNIASLRIIEKTGAKLYKKFRVYEKDAQANKKEFAQNV